MPNSSWFCASIVALFSWLAVQVAATGVAQNAEDTATTKGAAVEKQDLDAHYAKAYLRLVEATLAKYQEPNRRQPNTIRRGVIEALEENVQKAKERVQLAERDDAHHSDVYVASAEARLRLSQEALRKAEAANVQRPRTISETEMARLRAEIELAKQRVDRARHLASEPPLSSIEFELEQLREDVQQLRLAVALLRDRN
jgi:hypothetical protein